jgi:hypothetical protein
MFLLTKIDWPTVTKNLDKAILSLLLLAILLNVVERFELTYKWNLLIKVRGIAVKFGRLFWINSIGSFLGLFLPSSLGTDVVRGYYLVKNNSERSVSISSVFVDRVLGLISLLLLGLVALVFAGELVSKFNLNLYLIVLTFLTLIFVYLFQRNETKKILELLSLKMKKFKIMEYVMKLHGSILEYKKYPKTLLLSFVLTLLVQVTRVLTYYAVSLAFDVKISIIYFFLFVPLIMIVMMLPITIGGLGLREGTFVAFFTMIGMSVNDAVVITFINSILDTLNTLILGGGGYLFYKASLKEQITLTKSEETLNSNE